MLEMGAVYCITNLNDGRGTTYVGSTIRPLEARWNDHKYRLRAATHHNEFLQRAWIKYDEHSFEITLLEIVSNESLVEREQHWLDRHRDTGRVYNFGAVAAAPFTGQYHTEESLKKMSEANRGRSLSAEARARISVSLRGNKVSEETGRKISAALREHYKTHVVSEETRKKISDGMKRAWATITPEERERRGNVVRKRLEPEEVRRKMSEARMGHPVTEETRRKMSRMAKKRTRTPEGRAEMARRTSRPHPSFQNTQTGEIIPVGRNLTALCRNKGLSVHAMRNLIRGQQKAHRAWILFKEV